MKKLISTLLAAAMLTGVLSACGTAAAPAAAPVPAAAEGAAEEAAPAAEAGADLGEPVKLRIGHTNAPDTDWQKALEVFKEDLEKRTDGNITVEIYPSETLGPELDNITGIQQGNCEGVLSGESLSNWTPYAALVSTPYAVNSLDDLITIAESEEVGKVIEQKIIESAQLHPIGFFIRKPRNLTANREIRSIDDVKGLKIRVPNNNLSVALWNAFGASATPMAWSEVFTALQNGTLDAQENPSDVILSQNLAEVQDYVIKTEHAYSWIYVLLGENVWQSMTDAQRDAVMESAKVMCDYQHNYIKEQAAADEAALAEKMTIIEIDKAPFIEIAKKVLEDQFEPDVYELYLKMVEMNK